MRLLDFGHGPDALDARDPRLRARALYKVVVESVAGALPLLA